MLVRIGQDLQLISELEGRESLLEPGVVFTEEECLTIRTHRDPVQALATHFSVKEALFKSVPAMDGCVWPEVELSRDPHGAPFLRVLGRVRSLFEARGWRTHLSLSHSGGYVCSVVILEALERAECHG